jgi:hypothetical protein
MGYIEVWLVFAPGDQDAGTSMDDTIFFEGHGKDCDGFFAVEGGRLNMSTQRLAWGERSQKNSHLFAFCQMECLNEDCTKLQGDYLSTTGVGGSVMMEKTGTAYEAKNKNQ